MEDGDDEPTFPTLPAEIVQQHIVPHVLSQHLRDALLVAKDWAAAAHDESLRRAMQPILQQRLLLAFDRWVAQRHVKIGGPCLALVTTGSTCR